MKRLGLAVAIVAFVLAAPVGVLYVAVPPNETPQEGPADPILGLRRTVLLTLQATGLVHGPTFFDGWYLPTVGGSEIRDGGVDEEGALLWRMEIEREPVYRGVFWRVGYRITYRTTEFGDERNHWQVLRLCYAEDGRRFVAGEGTLEKGRDHLVKGYVPCSADGYWVEAVDKRGDVHSQHGWGDVREYWRDDDD